MISAALQKERKLQLPFWDAPSSGLKADMTDLTGVAVSQADTKANTEGKKIN